MQILDISSKVNIVIIAYFGKFMKKTQMSHFKICPHLEI